jgi:hypothetical protein
MQRVDLVVIVDQAFRAGHIQFHKSLHGRVDGFASHPRHTDDVSL